MLGKFLSFDFGWYWVKSIIGACASNRTYFCTPSFRLGAHAPLFGEIGYIYSAVNGFCNKMMTVIGYSGGGGGGGGIERN